MLTSEQLAARKGKLTASRIACLMEGDRAKILRLWQELIGDAVEEDLSRVWPVQLGEATEQLNLDWYAAKHNPVGRRGEVVPHPTIAWACCTLDGWDETLDCPIEVKHVGGFEPTEVLIDRYQPQMHWQMEVTRSRQCALSIIRGAAEPVIEYVDYDAQYADEMIERGAQFMKFVAAKQPPVELPPIMAPADATKIIDMTGNNQWATSAAIWLANKRQYDECRDARDILKSLVPGEAKRCSGYGVKITRDRAGRLSLRPLEDVR